MHAASPSTGLLVLAFLGQQSFPSPALAVVVQSHCKAYPFLKSTPHKYFVKHLLANMLFLIIFFLPQLLGRDAHSPVPLWSAALAIMLYTFAALKLPGLCLQLSRWALCTAACCPLQWVTVKDNSSPFHSPHPSQHPADTVTAAVSPAEC